MAAGIRARLTASQVSDSERQSRRDLRRFGIGSGVAVIVLFAGVVPWLHGRHHPLWPWAVGAALSVLALIAPIALKVVHTPLTRLALVINRLTGPLLMAFVYFLVITPCAWLMRATGRDPMSRKISRELTSYRVASRESPPTSMTRPF